MLRSRSGRVAVFLLLLQCSLVVFLLSQSVLLSGARRSNYSFQARLVRYGFSVVVARARKSVVGLVNHGCSSRWRRVRSLQVSGDRSRASLWPLWLKAVLVCSVILVQVRWCVATLVAPSPNKARPCLSGCLGLDVIASICEGCKSRCLCKLFLKNSILKNWLSGTPNSTGFSSSSRFHCRFHFAASDCSNCLVSFALRGLA